MPTPAGQFPIVAIGASAGGVEALTAFFEGLPKQAGAAFVIVTHLAPDRESFLSEILARHTAMTIAEVVDGEAIRQGHIHLIPPGAVMTMSGDRLTLSKRESERNPVDIFLASFARAMGDRAVAVILSGSGTDGAIGVTAVREAGGFTLAQSGGDSAPRYHGMPDAAIATGFVDCVLPVGPLAARVATFIETFGKVLPVEAAEAGNKSQPVLDGARNELYTLLREQVGHDFSDYKPSTFLRRVERRMQVRNVHNLSGYVSFVKDHPDELRLLFRDLLIGVTSFFRDRAAFDYLERVAIPRLFDGKDAEHPVRVWVAGCATGEEVYSIAILLREQVEKLRTRPVLQIFATDVDENALAVARAGRYPVEVLEQVAKPRLERFFVREGKSYAVTKELREICLFANHSLVRDPPFLNIDLISCRNLLIYFNADLQNRVVPLFHYALRPAGYLFLGASEHVSQHGDMFTPVDKAHQLFQRTGQTRRPTLFPPVALRGGFRPSGPTGAEEGDKTLQRAKALLLERFVPAHVVVDDDWNVIHYSENTGKYLTLPAGPPTRRLLAMAGWELQLALRLAMHEARQGGRSVRRRGVAIRSETGLRIFDLTIDPLATDSGTLSWLVVFKDVAPPMQGDEAGPDMPQPTPEGDTSARALDAGRMLQMERELRRVHDALQASVAEHETALEELKSSNEELISLNEEMQSSNEELESSKEELQSTNEELQTVNSELTVKMHELDASNNDLRNLFDSTQIAVVFLDRRLAIRSFTSAARQIFRLQPSDAGRPLPDIANVLEYDGLARDLQDVQANSKPVERQLVSRDSQKHYMVRILPYLDADRHVDGVVVTCIDVTDMFRLGEQEVLVGELNHRIKNVLAVVMSIAGETASYSPSIEEFTRSFADRIEGLAQTHDMLARGDWSDIAMADLLKGQLAPFVGATGRAELAGPVVRLPSRSASILGMVVHELATNAAKYGALSNESGRISLSWKLEPYMRAPGLELTWRENGGPSIQAPERMGFGSKFVHRSVELGLGGTATMEYAKSGLVVILAFAARYDEVVQFRTDSADESAFPVPDTKAEVRP